MAITQNSPPADSQTTPQPASRPREAQTPSSSLAETRPAPPRLQTLLAGSVVNFPPKKIMHVQSQVPV